MIKRKPIEWCDVWISGADAESLHRVLLVGDSITQSYFAEVEKMLAGRFVCARLTTSKSLCDPTFRKELSLVLDDYRFAVVHFNNGLHGLDYDETAYREHFLKMLRFIKQQSPGSTLIWASSTPCRRPENINEFDARTERVRERNRIAAECAAAEHIPVNDLFELVKDHPEYVGPDGVHFNERGRIVLGQQVARRILEQV